MSDGRVLMERDDEPGIARITLDNPERKNAYDPAMRRQLGAYLDELAYDDDIKVVAAPRRGRRVQHRRRHEQRLRLVRRRRQGRRERRRQAAGAGRASAAACSSTARRSTSTTSSSATRRSPWPRSRGFALGGGFELALMADIAVVGQRHGDRHAGHPLPRPGARVAAHVLPPARPGAGPAAPAHRRHHRGRRGRPPRRLHRGGRRRTPSTARAAWWAEKVVAHAGRRHRAWPRRRSAWSSSCRPTRARRSLSYLFHAYGTNLQFDEGEFNFVKARAEHGTKKAFELRDEHFEVPEP